MKPHGFWLDKTNCHNAALRCTYRYEFKKKYNRAYAVSCKNKWLDDICSHMVVRNGLYKKDIYAIISEEYSWIYIGISHDPKERYKGHLRKCTKNVKYLLSLPHKVIILEKGLLNQDASDKEKYYVNFYRSQGWIIANISKPGVIGNPYPKLWTKEKIIEIASQFSRRIDFYRAYPGAYDAALRKGWIEDCVGHLINHSKEIETEINGVKFTLTDLANHFNISRKTLKGRWDRGLKGINLINTRPYNKKQ